MGSHWTLEIAGYSALEGKNELDSSVLLLFRQIDAVVRGKTYRDGSRSFTKYHYRCTVKAMRDRLDLMGFTFERSRRDFTEGIRQELEYLREYQDEGELKKLYQEEERFFNTYTFDVWFENICLLVKTKTSFESTDAPYPHMRSVRDYILHSYDHENYRGFHCSDFRHFLRACLEAANPNREVKLDLLDIIEGGYYEATNDNYADAFNAATLEYSLTSPVIILTEGSTDKYILQSTLPLVYPHLVGFFTFLEFETTRVPGGASQLVASLKAFMGSGIKNRVLAVLDNDTGAHSALRALENVKLPRNLKAIVLPHLPSAESYPTLGPQGMANVDVNDLACSIELYLGPQVLGEDDQRIPIRWTGYDTVLRRYQGELLQKTQAQERFKEILPTLSASEVQTDKAWQDLRLLWLTIYESAKIVSIDISS